jgi:trk system potassium uptake protein TrkH
MVDPLERPAASYMHSQFVLVSEDVDVATAVTQMQAKRAETIIVVNKEGTPVGIITDSDILDQVVIKGEDSDNVSIRSVMTSPIITISSNTPVKDALQLMRINAIKRIPVRDNKGIIGIVTQNVLADAIRTSVIERTFRQYRSSIRERYKPILANLGFTLQFAGILMVAPALIGTILGETTPVAGIYLAVVGLFGTGFVFSAYGEKGPLSLKESSILVVSGFILLSFFGSIPYMYMNPFWIGIDPLSLFVNSYFESASGFTTTGLSTISLPEELPLSFNFYRSYTHWIGGLSFVYLVMLLFYPEKKLNSMKGLLGSGTIQFKQLLVTVSIIFTTYAVVLSLFFYVLGQKNVIFDAAFVMAALTGGGFVPNSTFLSLAHANYLFVLMTGMIISALPFAFHYSFYSKELRTRILGIEVVIYFIVLGISAYVLISLTGLDWITSSFHVVSASTNTGFQYANLPSLSFEAKLLIIILMLVGGTAYSAAGGIKVGRIILLLQKLAARRRKRNGEASELVAFRSYGPEWFEKPERHYKAQQSVSEVGSSSSDDKFVKQSLLVIGLFVSFALITGYALSYLDGLPFLDSTFEAVSALSTTGITMGVTTLHLDLVSKSILIMNMIVGKFEIIVVLYIFSSALRRQTT